MRWLIMLTMILTLFCSCVTTTEKVIEEIKTEEILKLPTEEIFIEPLLGFDLYYGDYTEIQDMYAISEWIMTNFIFVPGDTWNSPEEIMQNQYINFNGFTILLMNIAKVKFNIELNLAIIDVHDLLEYGQTNHALVEYQGIVYTVFDLYYGIFNRQPKYIYLFDKVFNSSHLDPNTIVLTH